MEQVALQEDVRPIFDHPELADAEYLRDVGTTKRLAEMLTLDGDFRRRFLADPGVFGVETGLVADIEGLRPLWDPETARRFKELQAAGEPLPELSLSYKRYRSFMKEKLQLRARLRAEGDAHHPVMAHWRRRQMLRCASELGPQKEAGLVHAPVAFELCRGCSVGCWFCAVGAEKLTAQVSHAQFGGLWRDVLHAVREVIGDAARWGFSYWATDPLDNPDYEDFCVDFAEILGRFPQTTTAIATRDVERTRRLLRLSQELGCELNRFSVLSMGLLRRIFASFSVEDLVYVELLPLNKESGLIKAFAGNARKGRIPQGQQVADRELASTIACVSGFLFNMVDQSIRLVTPCNASDRWENGYWTLAEATFRDGEECRRQLLRLIDEHMAVELDLRRPLRFRSDLAWSAAGDGAPSVASTWLKHGLGQLSGIEEVGGRLSLGGATAEELALEIERSSGAPMANTLFILDRLFHWGLLEESPAA